MSARDFSLEQPPRGTMQRKVAALLATLLGVAVQSFFDFLGRFFGHHSLDGQCLVFLPRNSGCFLPENVLHSPASPFAKKALRSRFQGIIGSMLLILSTSSLKLDEEPPQPKTVLEACPHKPKLAKNEPDAKATLDKPLSAASGLRFP
jgi:hypothetical protein